MAREDEAPSPQWLRASKCFEGTDPFIVWNVQTPGGEKAFLIADARQQSFGVRLEPARSADLTPTGAVVGLMRKHAPSGAIGIISRDPATGAVWIPLFTRRGGHPPDFWVQLARTSPPELRFIDSSGTALARKSSQGSYTKRRLCDPLPPYPPTPPLIDLSSAWLHPAPAATPPSPATDGEGVESPVATAAESSAAKTAPQTSLPAYQRDARDRLARRLKTVRRAHAKLREQQAAGGAAAAFAAQADTLAAHLDAVAPGADQLVLASGDAGASVVIPLDPQRSPGQNLADLYDRAKRARRATATTQIKLAEAAEEIAALATAVEGLRAGELPRPAVEAVLRRFKLPLVAQAAGPVKGRGEGPSRPYRLYRWPPPSGGQAVALRVGRNAAASDELVKASQGNDLWVHAVATTGSHVVVPARQNGDQGEGGGHSPHTALVRAAAVLALHYSKRRDDRRGEVYVSRRRHLRKSKGAAAGLWQIDQAETLFVAYDDAELQRVLKLEEP